MPAALQQSIAELHGEWQRGEGTQNDLLGQLEWAFLDHEQSLAPMADENFGPNLHNCITAGTGNV